MIEQKIIEGIVRERRKNKSKDDLRMKKQFVAEINAIAPIKL